MGATTSEAAMTCLTVNDDPLYDAEGAANYLGLVSVLRNPAQAVRALARKKKLRSTIIGGRYMFRRSWLEAYIERNPRSSSIEAA